MGVKTPVQQLSRKRRELLQLRILYLKQSLMRFGALSGDVIHAEGGVLNTVRLAACKTLPAPAHRR